MRDDQDVTAGDRPAGSERIQSGRESGNSGFPTSAVVGVIDEPGEVLRAADELRAAGYDPDVLSSEHGAERIENAGGSPDQVRVTRMAQGMFGYEADHTERHLAELSAGHFVLLVESHDDENTDRIRDVLARHGGHFVNYYSKWTSRTMIS
jgi:hypothetical protein